MDLDTKDDNSINFRTFVKVDLVNSNLYDKKKILVN